MASRENRTGRSGEEERPGFLVKLTKVNLCLLLTLVVPFCILSFRPPVKQEEDERKTLAKIEKQRDELVAEKGRLRRKLDLVQHDKDYLELMARDKLGLQLNGEVIFRFED